MNISIIIEKVSLPIALMIVASLDIAAVKTPGEFSL